MVSFEFEFTSNKYKAQNMVMKVRMITSPNVKYFFTILFQHKINFMLTWIRNMVYVYSLDVKHFVRMIQNPHHGHYVQYQQSLCQCYVLNNISRLFRLYLRLENVCRRIRGGFTDKIVGGSSIVEEHADDVLKERNSHEFDFPINDLLLKIEK